MSLYTLWHKKKKNMQWSMIIYSVQKISKETLLVAYDTFHISRASKGKSNPRNPTIWFNNTETNGSFVSFPRQREKKNRRDRYDSRRMKDWKRNKYMPLPFLTCCNQVLPSLFHTLAKCNHCRHMTWYYLSLTKNWNPKDKIGLRNMAWRYLIKDSHFLRQVCQVL